MVFKLPVGVVDQDNQTAELAVIHVATVTDAANQLVAVLEQLGALLYHSLAFQALGHCSEEGLIGSGAVVTRNAVTGNQLVALDAGIGVITCLVLDHGVTIDGGQVVQELVAMQRYGEGRAIGLSQLRRGGIGGCSVCHCKHQSHCKQ